MLGTCTSWAVCELEYHRASLSEHVAASVVEKSEQKIRGKNLPADSSERVEEEDWSMFDVPWLVSGKQGPVPAGPSAKDSVDKLHAEFWIRAV